MAAWYNGNKSRIFDITNHGYNTMPCWNNSGSILFLITRDVTVISINGADMIESYRLALYFMP